LRRHWLLVSALLLFVGLFAAFLDREPFGMPGKGAEESELIEWLVAREYTIFPVHSAATSYNVAKSEQLREPKYLNEFANRDSNGTLFTKRATSLRKSRFCWYTLRFVTWRLNAQEKVEEIHYSRSVCFF